MDVLLLLEPRDTADGAHTLLSALALPSPDPTVLLQTAIVLLMVVEDASLRPSAEELRWGSIGELLQECMKEHRGIPSRLLFERDIVANPSSARMNKSCREEEINQLLEANPADLEEAQTVLARLKDVVRQQRTEIEAFKKGRTAVVDE